MLHQRNQRIHSELELAGSLDAPWSRWSRITDPLLDHHKLRNTPLNPWEFIVVQCQSKARIGVRLLGYTCLTASYKFAYSRPIIWFTWLVINFGDPRKGQEKGLAERFENNCLTWYLCWHYNKTWCFICISTIAKSQRGTWSKTIYDWFPAWVFDKHSCQYSWTNKWWSHRVLARRHSGLYLILFLICIRYK